MSKQNSFVSAHDRKRSSYLSAESYDHKRTSIESLYNSILGMSISVSDANSIAEEVQIKTIQLKNKELAENMTNRITAFLYFNSYLSSLLQESSESLVIDNQNRENIEANPQNENIESLTIKNFLQDVTKMKKNCDEKLRRLESLKSEMNTLEDEEIFLNNKLSSIEDNVQKTLIEAKEKDSICSCHII